jgi:single-strand DNA-binding protein
VANAYFGDSKRDGDGGSYGGNSYGGNSYGGNSYGGNSYGAAPAAPSYGGYSAPASAPASDFAMLDDDDAQLPF